MWATVHNSQSVHYHEWCSFKAKAPERFVDPPVVNLLSQSDVEEVEMPPGIEVALGKKHKVVQPKVVSKEGGVEVAAECRDSEVNPKGESKKEVTVVEQEHKDNTVVKPKPQAAPNPNHKRKKGENNNKEKSPTLVGAQIRRPRGRPR